jgi:hypothetical protein
MLMNPNTAPVPTPLIPVIPGSVRVTYEDAARRDEWEKRQPLRPARTILLGILACVPFWLAVAAAYLCFVR